MEPQLQGLRCHPSSFADTLGIANTLHYPNTLSYSFHNSNTISYTFPLLYCVLSRHPFILLLCRVSRLQCERIELRHILWGNTGVFL